MWTARESNKHFHAQMHTQQILRLTEPPKDTQDNKLFKKSKRRLKTVSANSFRRHYLSLVGIEWARKAVSSNRIVELNFYTTLSNKLKPVQPIC